MASTYSALKFELIGTGEQSGTWGTTTNTNLGTAIEEAIVGYATANFTSDADLTISLTDTNASQTARNLVLNVTSGVSLTATRNLIVPTIEKPYYIFNNTTGSQSIVVKTSAGTGVTVPNGGRMFVYTDGTNVVEAINRIGSLTLGSALPVASGGTNGTAAPTAGAVAYGTGTAYAFTAAGSAGQVLQSNGSSAPTWASASSGSVTSVGMTVPAFLSVTGSPITTSGTLAVSLSGSALPVANGGTGSTTLTSNNVILGNGTSAVQVVAPGTNGNVLTSNGTTWVSSAPGGGALAAKTCTFNSSGTWTKPSGYGTTARVFIQAWGGGGSGAVTSFSGAGGGGGGGYNYRWISIACLSATETVTIGAGGAAQTTSACGVQGGTTTFGSRVSAYGGGGGRSCGVNGGYGGGGGGQLSSGDSFATPGAPIATRSVPLITSGGGWVPIEGSGAIYSNGNASWNSPIEGLYKGGGGGGSNTCASVKVGAGSVWGGGGGGGIRSCSPGAGGVSSYGGNGGTSNYGSGAFAGTGVQPGGGGGAAGNGATSGAGGAGRVVVTVYSGV